VPITQDQPEDKQEQQRTQQENQQGSDDNIQAGFINIVAEQCQDRVGAEQEWVEGDG
jgi:hypothetical protein